MKLRQIILGVSLLVNLNLFSQINMSGYIECGYNNIQNSLNDTYIEITGGSSSFYSNENQINRHENIIRYDRQGMYTDLRFKLSYKDIHLEQNIVSNFEYTDGYTFTPLEIDYKTRLYYEIKRVQIGAEHLCLHPIITTHNENEPITRRISHDKIFIRYNFGTK